MSPVENASAIGAPAFPASAKSGAGASRRVGRLRDSIPGFLGVVLLVAAGVKSRHIVSEVVGPSVWLSIALIEVELALGLALLFGVGRWQTRWTAMGLFTCFFAASGINVLAGSQSCSCLPGFEIKPWIALIFDALALSLLWLWRPISTFRQTSPFFVVAIAVGCIILVPLLAWFGANLRYPQLAVTTPSVDLGELLQGERRTLDLGLRNPHDQHVLIMNVQSSCPCLQALHTQWLIEPGKEVALPFELDMSKEHSFTGPLKIEVTGRTSAGELVFRTEITVQVKKIA